VDKRRVKYGYAYNPETGQKELVKVAIDEELDDQFVEEVRTSGKLFNASVPAGMVEHFELARDALLNMIKVRIGFNFTFSRLVRNMVINGQIEERDGEDYVVFKIE
jgi:hypothetical protein